MRFATDSRLSRFLKVPRFLIIPTFLTVSTVSRFSTVSIYLLYWVLTDVCSSSTFNLSLLKVKPTLVIVKESKIYQFLQVSNRRLLLQVSKDWWKSWFSSLSVEINESIWRLELLFIERFNSASGVWQMQRLYNYVARPICRCIIWSYFLYKVCKFVNIALPC